MGIERIETLMSLPPSDQARLVQSIYAGPDHPIFTAIKMAFLEAFPQCAPAKVFCGMAGGLGPINAIVVTTKRGVRINGLPSSFLGMPIIRKSEAARADAE